MMLARSSMLVGSLRRTAQNTTSIRFFSASADPEWTEKWTAATAATNTGDMTFDNSAARLRALTQTNLLKATDLRDAPERFFEGTLHLSSPQTVCLISLIYFVLLLCVYKCSKSIIISPQRQL
jgi:hypothetical protein